MTQLRIKQIASLKALAKENGGRFDVEVIEDRDRWGCGLYFQITDPNAKDDTLTNPLLTTKSYGEAREFLRGAFFERDNGRYSVEIEPVE